MILVVLGTQDKQFTRLLDDVSREIELGHIKGEVVVQAGQTKYKSDKMKILDLLPAPEFDKLMDKADLIITHGGAGTILSAIKKGKKIIATPRLAKYKEHHNDHQKQIIDEFKRMGYILDYNENDNLGEVIKKSEKFKPKKFVSNTQNMIELLENYIEDSNNTSWYHKYKEVLLYLFFGGCTTLVNIISFILLRLLNIDLYVSNVIAWVVAVLFAFVTNKLYVFESNSKDAKKTFVEGIYFFGCRLLSLFFDMGIMYLLVNILSLNEVVSKVVSNIFVIIINYFFSKMIIFKK